MLSEDRKLCSVSTRLVILVRYYGDASEQVFLWPAEISKAQPDMGAAPAPVDAGLAFDSAAQQPDQARLCIGGGAGRSTGGLGNALFSANLAGVTRRWGRLAIRRSPGERRAARSFPIAKRILDGIRHPTPAMPSGHAIGR